MGENEEKSLALELLQELKVQNRRWMIAFIAVLVAWVLTISAFIWYISLPVEDISVDAGSGNANYIGNDLSGVIYNGENSGEETSSQEP